MFYCCIIVIVDCFLLQLLKLRQAKNELERKVQDQEEELDEQAGTIQQLEQVTARWLDFLIVETRFGKTIHT